MCVEGYGGNLCDQCVKHEDTFYARLASHYCGICPATWVTGFRIVGVFIAVVCALSILVYFNSKAGLENETTVVLRIATNYF